MTNKHNAPTDTRFFTRLSNSISTRTIAFILISLGLIVAGKIYLFSVLWRVSAAEDLIFHNSRILRKPWFRSTTDYPDPATPSSHGDKTYSITYRGRTMQVHPQLINGFQHCFASAITTRDLGPFASDIIFRGNEYMESIYGISGGTPYGKYDTRKDLYNNRIGRNIGKKSTNQEEAREMALTATLDGPVISHWLDERVEQLPSANTSCPYLEQIATKCGAINRKLEALIRKSKSH